MDEHANSGDQRDRPKVEGWKAIADFFGRTERAVQLWERDGLKINRFQGRVWAYLDDLEEFRDKSIVRPPAPVMEAPVVHPVTESISLPAAKPNPRRWNHWRVTALAGCATTCLAGIWCLLPGPEPDRCQLSGNSLVVYDAGGKEAWRYPFAAGFHDFRYSTPALLSASCAVADVDGDRHQDLLFTYNSPRADSETNVLYAFGSARNWHRFLGPTVLGTFKPGHKIVIGSSADDVYREPYILQPKSVLVLDRSKGSNRIILTSVHNQGAASQIAVLDDRLRLVSEYWHPGHLLHTDASDLGRAGQKKVLLAGVNNGEHAATVLVFDGDNIAGTPQNLTDKRFSLTSYGESGNLHSLGPGSELVAITLPRTCVSIGKNQPYNRVMSLHVDPGKIVVEVAEDQSQGTTDILLYNFNHDFFLMEVIPQGSYATSYGLMQKVGICSQPLWNEGISAIKAQVRVRRRN